MDDSWRAAELAALERRLAGRNAAAAPPGLRGRILAVVRRELSLRPEDVSEHGGWRWWAVAAAAVLLWVNFSMSVVNNIDWRLSGAVGRADIERGARRLQELMPDLPAGEAFRQALLLRAASQVAPAPHGRVSLDRVLQQRKRESWDMR
jgi:hypothetical protein